MLRHIDPTPAISGPDANVASARAGDRRDPDVQRAGDSVVKVLGTACGLGVEGSGWVAGPGLVVTNAHVVAGEDDTTVTRDRAGRWTRRPSTTSRATTWRSSASPAWTLPALPLAPQVRQGHRRRGAGLSGERALDDLAGAGRKHRRGDQPGLLRPRPGATQDDPVSRPGARAATPAAPPSTPAAQVLTTVFAADAGAGPPGGLGVPDEIVRRALEGDLRPTDTGPCSA